MSLPTPSGKLARWVLLIQSFNLKIEYTPGKSNVIADMLSRPPCSDDSFQTCGVCSIEVEIPTKSSSSIRKSNSKTKKFKKLLIVLNNLIIQI